MTVTLSDHHHKILTNDSAIADNVIAARGYYSTTDNQHALSLGIHKNMARHVSKHNPAMVIPYHNTDGNLARHIIRYDIPVSVDDKKKGKLPDGTYLQKVWRYVMPTGVSNILDCNPLIINKLSKPKTPLFFTEGAKKADCLISNNFMAVNINGIWGWRGTTNGAKTMLPDFEQIALNGRDAFLVFDSDLTINENVQNAVKRFYNALSSRQAKPYIIPLPVDPNDPKVGIDDLFARGVLTVREFEMMLRRFQIMPLQIGQGKKHWKTEQIIEWFQQDLNLTFALNDLDDSIELNGKRYDDVAENELLSRARDEKIPVEHVKNALYVIAKKRRYHPIKNYLESLVWDGNYNIDGLSVYLKDKKGIFLPMMRRWLVGAVAKVYNGSGYEDAQNFMLVLGGKQNLGKSYFSRWLCPHHLRRDLFTDQTIRPDSKDCSIELMRRWIWEAGEFGNVTRRTDREALKHFLTRTQITERLPFGRNPTTKFTASSFIGTFNPEPGGLLSDPTGSRRFVVVDLKSINWDYAQNVDINQIWAEAYAAYKNGESFNLTDTERKTQRKVNKKHEIENLYVPMLQRYFVLNPKQTGDDWALTSDEILDWLGEKTERRQQMDLANALKELKIKKGKLSTIKGVRARYYRGIQKGAVARP